MSTIDFTCQKCEGTFECDVQGIISASEELECPHCANKPSKAGLEDFTAALADLQAQITALSKKFTLSLTIDSEDLDEVADEVDEDDDDYEGDDDEDDDEDDDDDDDDDDEAYENDDEP